MKKCCFTCIGIVIAAMAVLSGMAADAAKGDECCSIQGTKRMLRRKAGCALHTLGNGLNKAADSICE